MNDTKPEKSAKRTTVNARVSPAGGLDILSRNEVARLRDASGSGLHLLLRRCALAVLTSGEVSDDPRSMLEQFPNFDIQVLQQDRGIKIELTHAPARAFVDGHIIRGINELLVAVVRDIVYVATQLDQGNFELADSVGITHAVFEICATRACSRRRPIPIWSSAGAVIRLRATNTNTPNRSAISLVCAAPISAPVAVPAP